MKKNSFYQTVSDLVDYEIQKRKITRSELALLLNLSESYIKQIHSASSTRHYNISHLYLLSRELKLPIEDFIPTKNNLKKLNQFKNFDEKSIDKLLNQYELEVRRSDTYE
ncbi:TPA: hypothetical protein QFC69_001629 [Enterococcus faecium]|uniref:hypothetical protein n=1 Tax=Enterococcus TaxID=1350 RepID=UPI000DEAD880|nr:hypothetical protein [Enterococcus faecium]EME3500963.1 hypothetical protein [Enterococcus faecium]MDW3609479.1 hypothetical protein [Enterococcus faecium]RBT36464.1 hypothetical protein EA73_00012 [Enterococcus faecium]